MPRRALRNRRLRASAAGIVLLSCLPEPGDDLPRAPEVSVAPLADDGAERVLRFAVATPNVPLEPGDAWLFQGELSEYHLGRVNHRELPETLVSRRIGVNAWFDRSSGRTEVEPNAPLSAGGIYSLVAPGWGKLAEVQVSSASALPLLTRVWPPKGTAGGALAVVCGAAAAELPAADIELSPSRARVSVLGFAGRLEGGEACARLSIAARELPASWQVFPALSLGVLWDPEPLDFVAEAPRESASAVCEANELALGGACATVRDDGLSARNLAEPMLYAIERDGETTLFAVSAGGRFELRGLAPDSPHRVTGSASDRFGNERPFDVTFRTSTAAPHLVLNEVLANALGPEPQSEWIELLNDGTLGIELAGLRLQDSGGTVELPSARVEPGQYALLVRDDYVDDGVDVARANDALLVRVPALGKSGLSNAGEALSLLDPANVVLSRFPARPSEHPGVSLARRAPGAPDDARESFGEHAGPGASPGQANTLAE